MIQRLQEQHVYEAICLLEKEQAFNLYMLGNLESLGLTREICEFWGDIDQDGKLHAVINRYMTGWTIYGTTNADWRMLAAVMDDHPIPATRLQDNPVGTTSLLPYLTRYKAEKVHIEELMMLEDTTFRPQEAAKGISVRRADLADLPALVEFYADAGHMNRSAAAVEQPLRGTRLWLAEVDGEIRSSALTNAETRQLAMIGGVYTPPKHRGEGLSRSVCSALCDDLLAERKQPVLYWDTPAAGAVYRKLGFRSVGKWRSVWLMKG